MTSHAPSLAALALLPAALALGCSHEVNPGSGEGAESPYANGYGADASTGDPDDASAEEPTASADCPLFPVAGLSVQVVHDGAFACQAQAVAFDGDYQEALQRVGVGADCRYLGVFDRAGVYEVEVTLPGFAPAIAGGLAVALDACGDPTTQEATVFVTGTAEPDPRPLPSDPADPLDPATPTDPVGSTDPSDPTTPVDPADPVDSGDPTEPTTPTDPAPPASSSIVDCPANSEVFEGGITITSVDDERLAAVDCVHGDLVLAGPALASAPVGAVWFVAGDLVVIGTDLVELSDLDGVNEIGGVLRLETNAALDFVDLDNLDFVGGVVAHNNPALRELRLQSINALTGLAVEDNESLVRLDVSAVVTIDGDATVRRNAALDRLDSDALRDVAGAFTLEDGRFGQIDVQRLDTVGGDLSLVGNSNFGSLGGIDGVSTVGGDVLVIDNPQLTASRVQNWLSNIDVAGSATVCGNETGDACL